MSYYISWILYIFTYLFMQMYLKLFGIPLFANVRWFRTIHPFFVFFPLFFLLTMLKLFWGICIFLMITECMKHNYKNTNNLFNNHKINKKQFFIKSRLPLDKIKDNHIYDIKTWTKLGIKRYTNKKNNEIYSLINNKNINLETETGRKKIIIANWKCYLLKEEAYQLIDKLTQIKFSNYIDVIVSPNLLFLPYLHEKIKKNDSKRAIGP